MIGSYINNNKEVIVSDIIVPSDYRSSSRGFQPNPEDLNLKLKGIDEKYDGKLFYVGDWHSHPGGSNQFSSPDLQSITRVAKSSKVNTHNPILLIASFGENYFDPGVYVFFKNQLHKYQREN